MRKFLKNGLHLFGAEGHSANQNAGFQSHDSCSVNQNAGFLSPDNKKQEDGSHFVM